TGGLYMPPEARRGSAGYGVRSRRSVAQTPEFLLFEVCRDRRVGERNLSGAEAAERAQHFPHRGLRGVFSRGAFRRDCLQRSAVLPARSVALRGAIYPFPEPRWAS